MLEEVIKSMKKDLRDSIEEKKQIDSRKQEIEEELKELKEKISELDKENSKLLPTIYKKRNFIIALLLKAFSREYKENIPKEADNKRLLDELRKREEKLFKEKESINLKDPTADKKTIKDKSKELEKLEDRETAIKTAILRNPELTANPEFMKDLLNEDLRYIKYDKSNSPIVYQEYLQKISDKLEEKCKRPAENTWVTNVVLDRVRTICEEINNPKEVENSKYKIPQRFLFESLRKYSDYDLQDIETDPKIDMFAEGSTYIQYDGMFSKDYGKSFEELYENSDKYMLVHKVNASFIFEPREDALEKRENIFKDGLHSSTQDEGCVNSLLRTTLGNYQNGVTFMDMFEPDYKVVIMIPKEALKEGSNIPIWGLDRPEADEEHPGYILPEYIYGFVDPITEKIEKNPISLEERTKYPYKFLNKETVCMSNQTRE